MQAAVATRSTKVDLTEDRPITSGSTFFHSILIGNSTAVDYEVVFNDKDGTEILSIMVPATKSFEYFTSFFADNGLTVVGLRDSGVTVTLAFTDSIVPVAASAYADTKALDLATNETLYNSSDNPIGIANAWSFQINTKPGSDSINMYLLRAEPVSGVNNRIAVHLEGNVANDPFRVQILRANGNALKDFRWNSTYTSGTKVSYIVTWDGTDLLMYVDGVLTTADTKISDFASPMSATDRRISVGSANGAVYYTGTIHSTSLWDVALTQAEVTALQNGGSPQSFDNRFNLGGYTSKDNLQHYWRHGGDASDIGRDFGQAATLIDIGDNAINVTSADIVDY